MLSLDLDSFDRKRYKLKLWVKIWNLTLFSVDDRCLHQRQEFQNRGVVVTANQDGERREKPHVGRINIRGNELHIVIRSAVSVVIPRSLMLTDSLVSAATSTEPQTFAGADF